MHRHSCIATTPNKLQKANFHPLGWFSKFGIAAALERWTWMIGILLCMGQRNRESQRGGKWPPHYMAIARVFTFLYCEYNYSLGQRENLLRGGLMSEGKINRRSERDFLSSFISIYCAAVEVKHVKNSSFLLCYINFQYRQQKKFHQKGIISPRMQEAPPPTKNSRGAINALQLKRYLLFYACV